MVMEVIDMKKFFAVLLMAATILSVAQIVEPVTAYAKDVGSQATKDASITS